MATKRTVKANKKADKLAAKGKTDKAQKKWIPISNR